MRFSLIKHTTEELQKIDQMYLEKQGLTVKLLIFSSITKKKHYDPLLIFCITKFLLKRKKIHRNSLQQQTLFQVKEHQCQIKMLNQLKLMKSKNILYLTLKFYLRLVLQELKIFWLHFQSNLQKPEEI